MFMFLAPLLLKFFPSITATTMKWLSPLVTVVGIILLVVVLYFGAVLSFGMIQRSDNNDVRAKLNQEWKDKVAKGEAAARVREAVLRGMLDTNARLFGERAAQASAKAQIIMERTVYEAGKDRVVYGGCKHSDGMRAAISDAVRALNDSPNNRAIGNPVPDGPPAP